MSPFATACAHDAMEELDVEAEGLAPHSPDPIASASSGAGSAAAACEQPPADPDEEQHPCGLFSVKEYETAIRVLNALAPHTEGEQHAARALSPLSRRHVCVSVHRSRSCVAA